MVQVIGTEVARDAVFGQSESGRGSVGTSISATGVEGNSISGAGVFGLSQGGIGVFGVGPIAGRFEGDVEVTGDIRLLNADCAENFDVAADAAAEPGMVLVLQADGMLAPCDQPYDSRAVGVVSGAGRFRPGLVLDTGMSSNHRRPVALLGKVYCWVDADAAPVAVGDLLTTSATPGHGMRVLDRSRAVGAVIGKALQPLAAGRGLIAILVTLQ